MKYKIQFMFMGSRYSVEAHTATSIPTILEGFWVDKTLRMSAIASDNKWFIPGHMIEFVELEGEVPEYGH